MFYVAAFSIYIFFISYCDNLFNNVDLFYISCHYGISVCKTAQSFPKIDSKYSRIKLIRKQLVNHSIFKQWKLYMIMCMLWYSIIKTLFSLWSSFIILEIWPSLIEKDFLFTLAVNNKNTMTSIWSDWKTAVLLLSTYSVNHNFNMNEVDWHD